MRLIIVAVFDSAAQAFNRPFYVPAVGMAVRSFRDEVNREAPENSMYHHPNDFELFELGQFDDQTGRFELLPDPRSIARAIDMREA